MNSNNDDFHFDDIDAFCREDINSLIDKALGVKKETKKVELFSSSVNLDKKEKKIETLEFEFDVPNDVKVEEIEIMDFNTDTEVECLDFDTNNDIETLDFDDNNSIETFDFELDSNNTEVLKIEDNSPEYLDMDFEDITDAVDYAFSEEVTPEPEFFDFDLEEMDDIEILDDSFFNQEEEVKSKINNEILKKRILIGILVVMLVALIFVVYKIVRWKLDNDSIKKQVNNIHSYVSVEDVEDNKNTVVVDENIQTDDKLINVNFDELKSANADTVAWIKVEGTNIDYPVVQTSDNKYYLTHSFDKSYNEAGWVFADYRNSLVDDKNLVIYGHARLNETMFGSLKNVTKSFWYENSDNYVIKLSTPTVNSSWLVFSTYIIPAEDYYITTNFVDDMSFYEFIKILRARSVYDYNVELNSSDRILTLSTCYSDNKRVVLHAKLIKYENKRQ